MRSAFVLLSAVLHARARDDRTVRTTSSWRLCAASAAAGAAIATLLLRPRRRRGVTLAAAYHEDDDDDTRAGEGAKSYQPGAHRLPIQVVAPFLFPMNGSRLALPPDTTNVVVDVGARNSRLLALARGTPRGPYAFLADAAVVLFEPMPSTHAAVAADIYGDVLEGKPRRHFAVNAAVAETWGTATFREGVSGACGSLLATSATNKFWCANTRGEREVATMPLVAVLSILPTWLPWSVLKIDAEGYDLGVAKSGRGLVARFEVVLMECQHLGPGSAGPNVPKDSSMDLLMRVGGCVNSEAISHMSSIGFAHSRFQEAGKPNPYRQGDLMFTKTEEALRRWQRVSLQGETGDWKTKLPESYQKASNQWN